MKDIIDSGRFNEEETKAMDVPFFDLESILAATNKFSNSNKLGQGGFGPVYKVITPFFFHLLLIKKSDIKFICRLGVVNLDVLWILQSGYISWRRRDCC